MTPATTVLIVDAGVACLAVAWGVAATLSLIFPGPSGEWAGLMVYAAYVVDIPAGLITLGVALRLKQHAPRLRRFCIICSLIALALPVIADVIWRSRLW